MSASFDSLVINEAKGSDAAEIARLVNSAYRGETSRFGWTTEADFLDGSRTNETSVAALIDPARGHHILVARGEESTIIACVYLAKTDDGFYLGMLTVDPKLQDRGLGRRLLDAAEQFAKTRGASVMTMGVIQLRGTLIAWYERQGYQRTGRTKPFPYDQPEAGIPRRPDLYFEYLTKPL